MKRGNPAIIYNWIAVMEINRATVVDELNLQGRIETAKCVDTDFAEIIGLLYQVARAEGGNPC